MRSSLLVLFFLFAVGFAQESGVVRTGQGSFEKEDAELELMESEDQDRRQLWDLFSLLFLLTPDPHLCERHPYEPPKGPLRHRWCSECGSCEEISTSDGDTDYVYTPFEEDSGYDTDISNGVQGNDENSSSGTVTASSTSALSFIMLVVAALAATTALVAVIIGQRKQPRQKHQLEGSVARRITLFQTFADSALCGSKRPERVVEMTNSEDDYRLA